MQQINTIIVDETKINGGSQNNALFRSSREKSKQVIYKHL